MADAIDTFARYAPGLSSPATGGEAVTPNDSADLAKVSRMLFVGGAGSLTVTMQDGGDVMFAVVPAGTTLPIRVSRVKATGTTATGIVAFT